MNKLAKQDRNGVRTPADIERRYNFNKLDDIEDTDERLTNLEDNKVDKVAGKNLSSNDFTNGYKTQVDENTEARHTHSNQNILDTYTKTETQLEEQLSGTVALVEEALEKIDIAVEDSHSHSNKSVLDQITQSMLDNIGASESDIYSYSSSDYEGYLWLNNGYLEQWGRITISPTSANTVTSATVYFPYSYNNAPSISAIPQVGYPNLVTCSVGAGATLATAKTSMVIYMTRTNTSATTFRWRAKGYRNP